MKTFTLTLALLAGVLLLVGVQAQTEEGVVKYRAVGNARSNSNSNSNDDSDGNDNSGGDSSEEVQYNGRLRNIRARSKLNPTEAGHLAKFSMALSRNNRATCKMSTNANVNNGICATHCIAKGNKGGRCNKKAICQCT